MVGYHKTFQPEEGGPRVRNSAVGSARKVYRWVPSVSTRRGRMSLSWMGMAFGIARYKCGQSD